MRYEVTSQLLVIMIVAPLSLNTLITMLIKARRLKFSIADVFQMVFYITQFCRIEKEFNLEY